MELLNKTIIECFEERVKVTPDKTAIEYKDECYTWKQLDDISDMLALKFIHLGIKRNTHVAICMLNNPGWVCSFLAMQKIESVALLVNPYCKEKELSELMVNADIEFLCYGNSNEGTNYKDIISNIDVSHMVKFKEFIYMGESRDCIIDNCNALSIDCKKEIKELRSNVKSSDTACILFTSGTTSGPKGVMLSHNNIVNTSLCAVNAMHWNSNDKMCVAVPLYHSFGLSACLMASIHCGCEIELLEKSKTAMIFEIIEKHKCTVLNGVPSMFLAMINNPIYAQYNLSSLNSGIIAGSFISKKDYMKICSTLNMRKLQMSYGLTEASPSVTFSDYLDNIEKKSENVGKAIPGIELSILNNRCIKTQNANEIGEILVKGFNVMKGYYNNAEDTKKAVDEEGWLHTGDIGYLNEDKFLYIVGRKKEVIIRCGENISPYEIEECILNYPEIMQTKVIGIKAEVTQEEIAACVILKKNEQLNHDEFRKYLSEKLAYYKVPKYILEFEKFPMTSNGKIDLKKISNNVYEKLNVVNI